MRNPIYNSLTATQTLQTTWGAKVSANQNSYYIGPLHLCLEVEHVWFNSQMVMRNWPSLLHRQWTQKGHGGSFSFSSKFLSTIRESCPHMLVQEILLSLFPFDAMSVLYKGKLARIQVEVCLTYNVGCNMWWIEWNSSLFVEISPNGVRGHAYWEIRLAGEQFSALNSPMSVQAFGIVLVLQGMLGTWRACILHLP